MIPEDFLDRMQDMLGEEYGEFQECLKRPEYRGLRLNLLKAEKRQFLEQVSFALSQVPWAESGFYYEEKDAPGKHPYHEAGVYYIQEPSAMAPVWYLGAKPGEKVLDLCAAPGGKSTQIAACMEGGGLLICNEIHSGRAKILSENIERMGIRNAVVTNETPSHLSLFFENYFDRILVDAPCSGEGMFRKNEEACREWSRENVELCAKRQGEILDCAAVMLKPGGRLVYSTCTFAPDENEGSIVRFLAAHPEFDTLEVPFFAGMERAVPEWCSGDFGTCGDYPAASDLSEKVKRTIRLWPHKLMGEGHYLAVLEKAENTTSEFFCCCRNEPEKGIAEKECMEYLKFAEEELCIKLQGGLMKFGEQLYLFPEGMPSLKGIKALRPGLHLGTMKKNRFEPSHALALALKPEDAKHCIRFSSGGAEIRSYLNGQTLNVEGEKGWYLVAADDYSIGWGKLSGGVLKNHYPKGLRGKIMLLHQVCGK